MAQDDTLVVFTPLSAELPGSNSASVDVRNNHPIIDFDASADEYVNFSNVIPNHYDNGDIKAIIHYSMSSATTGNVIWNVAFERIDEEGQSLDSDGFAAYRSVTDTVPSTNGHIGVCEITFTQTQADSVEKGEGFRISVYRDTDDTAAGDAELNFIELREV